MVESQRGEMTPIWVTLWFPFPDSIFILHLCILKYEFSFVSHPLVIVVIPSYKKALKKQAKFCSQRVLI